LYPLTVRRWLRNRCKMRRCCKARRCEKREWRGPWQPARLFRRFFDRVLSAADVASACPFCQLGVLALPSHPQRKVKSAHHICAAQTAAKLANYALAPLCYPVRDHKADHRPTHVKACQRLHHIGIWSVEASAGKAAVQFVRCTSLHLPVWRCTGITSAGPSRGTLVP
jgi:hypothetical protein